jgi:membrane protease subunit HflC
MIKKQYIAIAVILFIAFLVLNSAVYIVNETEQVIVTQFGNPVGDPVTTAGVHVKMPFIQKANFFDKRFLEWDGDANQIPTKDKRFIWVDTYGRWKIVDPLLFFQRLSDERSAQTRLDDILDGQTRNVVANNNLVEIVRSTNRDMQISENLEEIMEGQQEEITEYNIEVGRMKIAQKIIEQASPQLAELGIELLDLRFKRINYVKEVQQKIFDRMISERKRIADKFRSEGQGEAAKILGDKERDLKEIQSEAYRQAEEIKGKADAEATNIYARAYNQSSESREFYRFIKTMETYQNTLTEKDWLVLSTEGDFFRYLNKQSGR